MTPTPFDIEAEKILTELHWLPIQDRYEKPHPIYPGEAGLRDEHIEAALSQLHNLYMQGQIDELKSLNKALFVESAIEARIATLEAQLTLKGDKDE